MSRQNNRLHRRKKTSKRGLPSIKTSVTKFILFASVIIFILSLTQEQWMASLNKKKNTSDIKNEQTSHEANEDQSNANAEDKDVDKNESNNDNESENTDGSEVVGETTDEGDTDGSEVAGETDEEESSTSEEDDETDSSTEDTDAPATNDVESQDNENDSNIEVVIHKVKDNETLYKISMKYYGSRKGEAIIKEFNNLNDNNIYVGQVLEIPLEN
jgi:LysM repeat protein